MCTLLLSLFFGACSFQDGGEGRAPRTVLVEVAEAREGTLQTPQSFLGDVRALERAELAAGATGEVKEVTVREGDHVGVSTILVQVDSGAARARLRAAEGARNEARATLDEAESQVARLQRVSEGVVAEHELEQAQARMRAATARHESLAAAADEAAAIYSQHRVRAPFTGVVAARRVDVGDWVSPGQRVLDLVSSDAVEVVVSVPPHVAPALTVGDVATLNAVPPVPGSIAGIVPALDPTTRTVLVRVVPEEKGALMPGSSVQVVFDVATQQGIVVPRDALVLGPAGARIAEMVDGKAVLVSVEVLATSADEAVVRADELKSGDSVVVKGNERLRPGQDLRTEAP